MAGIVTIQGGSGHSARHICRADRACLSWSKSSGRLRRFTSSPNDLGKNQINLYELASMSQTETDGSAHSDAGRDHQPRNRRKFFLPVIDERVYICEEGSIPRNTAECSYHVFKTSPQLRYIGYCDDFGPMNLSCVMRFGMILEDELAAHPDEKIVYCAERGRRPVTNAVFLMGSYLVLVMKRSPDEIWSRFESAYNFEPYRDATFVTADFGLTLLDCWRGLACGRALGWIGENPDEGVYDLAEYEHYDDPANGELHVVVPDKFLAFRGPKTLAEGQDYDDSDGVRRFAAQYYVDIFHELGVSTVVRLNEPQYDEKVFKAAGIDHFDLEVYTKCRAA